LHSGDQCNLGSVNESQFATSDHRRLSERYRYVVSLACRMLDTVIDIASIPVEKVAEMCKANRRVGLGTMGFAEYLVRMHIGYATDAGIKEAEQISHTRQTEAWKTSYALGKLKGTFPNVHLSVFNADGEQPRNCNMTNVPPTGSTAMLVNTSSGIEPYFAMSHYASVMRKEKLYYLNSLLIDTLEKHGLATDEIINEVSETGTVKHIKALPDWIKEVFVTAMDMDPDSHIKMQATFQKHCDNAISKVNEKQHKHKSNVLTDNQFSKFVYS